MVQLKPIHEQVVVIMGASSGIGRLAAKRFAERGAKVVVAARGEAGLRTLADEIRMAGGEATVIPADTSDFSQVQAVADGAVERYGRLDTWVQAAAVAHYAYFWETPMEEWRHIVEVDLIGNAYGARAALSHMMERGGALIHISSVLGRISVPYQSAYSAAKHGIIGFVDSLRLELRHANIPVSVTNIMPAAINTPFFNNAKTYLGVKPMGTPPFYSPQVVVDAILHAAEHPTRDMFAGGAARAFDLLDRLSPRLVDELLLRTGFESQKTKEPKLPTDSHNLFEPLDKYDQVEGDFSNQALSHSIATQIDMQPVSRRLVTAAATLGLAAVLGRVLRDWEVV
ncbi:MAG: SDR family oxidoreductase [Chloroflexaceae bacterium]|jgi:short-subunit dehydrogenase|nr:SDR family oxidoreductase [Chloroflexaceae bacterium]